MVRQRTTSALAKVGLLAVVGLVPAACNGRSDEAPTAPTATGVAVYVEDDDPTTTAGDRIFLTLSEGVDVSAATAGDFALLVLGDTLGDNPVIATGATQDEVVITLGANASIKTRGGFTPGAIVPNASSGIDLATPAVGSNAVVSMATGAAAVASGGIDITPGFRDSGTDLFPTATVTAAVVADFDDDGRSDLLLAVSGAGNMVLVGGVAGSLFDSGQSLGTTPTRALATGDVNGDGRLDFVEGNDGGVANRVWLGDGTGGFTGTAQQLGGESTRAVALADLDVDGDLDLATGNVGANHVWLGKDTGSFTRTTQNLDGFATEAVAVGDLDGDGDADLVYGNRAGQPSRVHVNDRTGMFVDSGQNLGLDDTSALALGDVDRDGDLDLVAGNFLEPNRVHWNDGSGTFAQSLALGDALPTVAIALTDTDHDGDLDFIEGNADGESAVHWLGDGAGGFTPTGQRLDQGDTAALCIVDSDRDGDPDILVVDRTMGTRVLFNSLSGTWGTTTFLGSGLALGMDLTTSVGLADLDRDGKLDLVEAIGDFQPNRVFFGDGLGGFADSGLRLGVDDTRAVVLIDVDIDGDVDIAEANDAGFFANRVYLNAGDGYIFDSEQTLGDSPSVAVAAGDLNGTGLPDLVFGNRASSPNTVWVNNEITPGKFARTGELLGAESTFAVTLGDFDLDGDLDLATGNEASDRVYWNNGLAFFRTFLVLEQSDGGRTRAMASGDLDGDGDLDLVAGVEGADNRVWLNEDPFAAAGAFFVQTALLGGGDTTSLVLADVEGDGDLDIVEANFMQPARVRLGDGSGAFPAFVDVASVGATLSLAPGDVDRDGDLDLFVGNDGQPNTLLLSR